jgi:hypothetical protein
MAALSLERPRRAAARTWPASCRRRLGLMRSARLTAARRATVAGAWGMFGMSAGRAWTGAVRHAAATGRPTAMLAAAGRSAVRRLGVGLLPLIVLFTVLGERRSARAGEQQGGEGGCGEGCLHDRSKGRKGQKGCVSIPTKSWLAKSCPGR